MKIGVLLFVAASVVCSSNVQAQELRKIIGPTSSTCVTWTEGRAHASTMAFAQLHFWAMGYTSGANSENRTDFLKGIDGDAISAWLDKYCREHPLQSFIQGVVALTNELEKRVQPK